MRVQVGVQVRENVASLVESVRLFLTVLLTHFFGRKVLRPFVVPKGELRRSAFILFHSEGPLQLGKTAAKIEFIVILRDVLPNYNSVTLGIDFRLNQRLDFL